MFKSLMAFGWSHLSWQILRAWGMDSIYKIRIATALRMWEFSAMPYDPRPANAARLKMFHLIADKIERNPDCLQTGLDNIARWIGNGSTQQDKLREDSERAEFGVRRGG